MKKTILSLALFASFTAFAQTPAPNEPAAASASAGAVAAVPDDYYDGEYVAYCQSRCQFNNLDLKITGNSGFFTIWPRGAVRSPCLRGTSAIKVANKTSTEVTLLIDPISGCNEPARTLVLRKENIEGRVVLSDYLGSGDKFTKR